MTSPLPALSPPTSGPHEPLTHGDAPRAPRRPWRIAAGTILGAALLAAGVHGARMTRAMARPVPPTDVGTIKTTVNGRYAVRLVAEREPVPLNRVHRWTVRLTPTAAAAGAVGDVTVSIDGGMPQHGHGLPTAPRVTGRLPDGRLIVDGMKFSMPGWWELRVRVAGATGTDSVTFNLTL